jgi:uncharacterized protein (TIGR02453 family)
MISSSTLKFLKQLKRNNNKPWFDAHRSEYEAARADFAGFVQQLIDAQGKKDPGIRHLLAKQCMFRINRDVRFSKDKSPYKTNFGASINMGGKQAVHSAGYYFHLEPGGSFAGGGIWMPPADVLRRIRQEVDYNLDEFKSIIQSRSFKTIYGGLAEDAEYKLMRVPKGYEPDNPAAEYLKYKSYIASISLSDEDLISPQLLKKTLKAFETLQPLLQFLNRPQE